MEIPQPPDSEARWPAMAGSIGGSKLAAQTGATSAIG